MILITKSTFRTAPRTGKGTIFIYIFIFSERQVIRLGSSVHINVLKDAFLFDINDPLIKGFLPQFLNEHGLLETFDAEFEAYAASKANENTWNTLESATSSYIMRTPPLSSRSKLSSSIRHFRSKRRSSLALFAGGSPNFDEPPDLHRKLSEDATTDEKVKNMPLKLQRIYETIDSISDEDKYKLMGVTWNFVIKTYVQLENAMHDWVLAWKLEKNDMVVKLLESMTEEQRLLVEQASIANTARGLGSLAVQLVDSISDILLGIYYFQQGQFEMGWLTLAWPIASQLVQTVYSYLSGIFFVILATIFGLRPCVDTMRVLNSSGEDMTKAIASLSITRGISVLLKAYRRHVCRRSI